MHSVVPWFWYCASFLTGTTFRWSPSECYRWHLFFPNMRSQHFYGDKRLTNGFLPVRAVPCLVFDTFTLQTTFLCSLVFFSSHIRVCTHLRSLHAHTILLHPSSFCVSILSTSSFAFSTLLLLYQQYLSCMSRGFVKVGAYRNKSNVARLYFLFNLCLTRKSHWD